MTVNRERRRFLATLAFAVVGLVSGSAFASDRIRQAQVALKRLGYDPGPADGVYGPQTRSAIERFQRDNGLGVTGHLNDATINELRRDTHNARRRRY